MLVTFFILSNISSGSGSVLFHLLDPDQSNIDPDPQHCYLFNIPLCSLTLVDRPSCPAPGQVGGLFNGPARTHRKNTASASSGLFMMAVN